MGLGRTEDIVKEREADLAQFASFAAKDLSDADVLRAQRSVASSYAAVRTSTKGERDALVATQATWKAYRAAEVAFYEHAFGPTEGAARVRATVSLHLDERRARECDAPSLSGEQ